VIENIIRAEKIFLIHLSDDGAGAGVLGEYAKAKWARSYALTEDVLSAFLSALE
jgi:hypothetical protein